MGRILFYFRYAFRNIRRGGRWTVLAIFCIAAGVATVVALRSLGLSITDALLDNVRQDLKGDVIFIKGNRSQFAATFDPDDDRAFSPSQIDAIGEWAAEKDATYATWALGGNQSIAAVDDENTVGRPQFIGTYYIDPQTYPPTHNITTLDPPNTPLAELFSDDANEVVISQNMADAQDLIIGDTVRVSGAEALFTVVGIVDAAEEVDLRNPLNAFFGFVYLDIDDAQRLVDESIRPNVVGVVFPEPLQDEETAHDIYDEINASMGYPWIDSAPRQLRRNAQISQVLGDFIVTLGLGALLIGGVGIMNTMLVMVRRRTVEIAAMKTFGLKGRQVAGVFFAEGIIFGLAGSFIGGLAGTLLGGIVNQYGETFLQQRLVWRIYPEALLYGLVLGLVTTAIFSIAPIMTALRIRPGIILRPNESSTPGMGILQSILLLFVIIIVIGLVVGQIIQPSVALGWEPGESLLGIPAEILPYALGMISVAGTLITLGILTMLLWVVVWLIGKLPSFGSVNLRLALRNMSTYRIRTATTLLALSAGMFALSSIVFVGEGARELLNIQLSRTFGGNVVALPLSPGSFGETVATFAINGAVANVEGIRSRTILGFEQVDLFAVNGADLGSLASFPDEQGRNFDDVDFTDPVVQAQLAWGNFLIWDSDNPDVYANNTIVAGRNLTLEDRGQSVLIAPQSAATPLGIEVGDLLTFDIDNTRVNFELVGLTADEAAGLIPGAINVPPDAIETSSDFRIYAFDVEEEHVNDALVALSAIRIPPTFSLDVTFIDSLLSRLIDQFAAIPTVVGLLSLVAAAVIMANTVALSTLERRRQIGILKSIGLKSRRVLTIMLLETGIIGLLSAVLGLGLSSIFVTIFTGLSGVPIPLPANARMTAVALVVAALLIGWIATFLSAGTAVRERVMNVLRYD